MKIFKKPLKVDPKAETVTINVLGDDIVFDVSEAALSHYAAERKNEEANMWHGKNEIEKVCDNGNIIYKYQPVTGSEREMVGFYGQKLFSDNGRFCLVYSLTIPSLALIDTVGKNVIYKTTVVKPCAYAVGNNGYIFFCDADLNFDNKDILILDEYGDIHLQIKMNAFCDKSCFSNDGALIAFSTLGSKYLDNESLFVIDVQTKKVIHQTTLNAHLTKIYFEGNKVKVALFGR